jgi:hypothetical protein
MAALISVIVMSVVFAVLVGLVFAVRALQKSLNKRALENAPTKLTLKPLPKNKWPDAILMERLATPLSTRSFKDIGAYTVSEISGLVLRFMLNEEDSALAIVVAHPKGGHWVEIASYFVDGTTINYSTSHTPAAPPRVGHPRFKGSGMATGALYTKFKQERPKRPLVKLTPENSTAEFLKGFTDEATWRKERGVVPQTFAAITRVAAPKR